MLLGKQKSKNINDKIGFIKLAGPVLVFLGRFAAGGKRSDILDDECRRLSIPPE